MWLLVYKCYVCRKPLLTRHWAFECKLQTILSAQEFTLVSITAVYVPPSVDTIKAMKVVHQTISELQSTHTHKGFFIVVGDFNQANMKSVLLHFQQHVDFATRGVNTLDMTYTTMKMHSEQAPAPISALQTIYRLHYFQHISHCWPEENLQWGRRGFGLRGLKRPYRIVLSALTGICSQQLPLTMIMST